MQNRKKTLLLLFAGSLGLGVLSLLFAMKENRLVMLKGYFSSPLLLLLNILPCVLLTAVFFAVFKRAAAAFALAGAVVMGFTWTGWFKLQFRNDPLLAEDLGLLKEAGDMAGKYQLFIPLGLVLCVLAVVVWTFLLARYARWKPSGKLRLGVFLAAAVLLLPLRTLYFSSTVYSSWTNGAPAGRWDVTQVYQSKGFVYPFLHSFRKAVVSTPDGYRKKDSESRISSYQNTNIPEERKVNIIAVMLESYCDFSDVPNAPLLKKDVYAPLHNLQKEGISGTLLTNIFAGGTINSERSFLTGYPVLPSFQKETDSFVWYLRGQGYHTTGGHPGNKWFYQRDKISANLGFQEYLFLENHYGALSGGGIAPDDVLFPELARLCAEEDEPYFSFTVSYQGHGPYPDNENVWGDEFIVNNGYSDTDYHILNNYFGSVDNTGRNLAKLADTLRESPSPTVLVVFGDHKPWLGDNQSVYQALEMPVGCGTDEGFLCHYATQYLIWGNVAAKEALGTELQGQGPTIGPSMLMCTLFDALGWQGPPLMQEQRALMEAGVSMYHSVAENVLFNNKLCAPEELPETVQELLKNYFCDAYYLQTHFSKP